MPHSATHIRCSRIAKKVWATENWDKGMNDAIGYRLQAKVQRIRHSCSSSAVLNQDDPDLEVSQRCFWEAGDWVGSKQQAEIQNPPPKKRIARCIRLAKFRLSLYHVICIIWQLVVVDLEEADQVRGPVHVTWLLQTQGPESSSKSNPYWQVGSNQQEKNTKSMIIDLLKFQSKWNIAKTMQLTKSDTTDYNKKIKSHKNTNRRLFGLTVWLGLTGSDSEYKPV